MDNKLWIIQLWTTVGCYCFVQNCTQKWQSKITVPPVSWKHQCVVCISRKADFLQGSEWTVREQLLSKDAARELYCWLTWRSYKCLCSHLKCVTRFLVARTTVCMLLLKSWNLLIFWHLRNVYFIILLYNKTHTHADIIHATGIQYFNHPHLHSPRRCSDVALQLR